jgi:hypothetical protein
MRITTEVICSLKRGEIFVFGSNTKGIHGAGAAKVAKKNFHAKQGVGIGPTGNCYAIPTKSASVITTGDNKTVSLISLSIDEIAIHISNFIDYAASHPEMTFLVIKIGCGLAGYKVSDIAPLFRKALSLTNVYLPREFHDYYMTHHDHK